MESNRLDRLMPRHPVAPRELEVVWDLRPARRLPRKRPETFEPGQIVDISLDGALVELIGDEARYDVDDVVTVRLGDETGKAVVKHRHQSEAKTSWSYGVQWIPTPGFKKAVEDMVGTLRGNSHEVLETWERLRR